MSSPLQLEVCGLEDGDARAAYRNINFDMRMYKRLRMFVHAEAARADEPLESDDLTCFVRLGSDFVDNYYEYEIPLAGDPLGHLRRGDGDLASRPTRVDLRFQDLQNPQSLQDLSVTPSSKSTATSRRRCACDMRCSGNPQPRQCGHRHDRYPQLRQGRQPVQLQTTMAWTSVPLSGPMSCRLSEFNEEGGWAATAQLQATLSDLG